MLNLAPVPEKKYSEEDQNNPLRWCIVKKDGETLQPQTGWFKCKDFFNDVLAAKNGVFFTIYGFDNKTLDLNKDTLQFVVKSAHADLIPNLEKYGLLNFFSQITSLKANKLYFEVPWEKIPTNFDISLLTWLIRLSSNPDTPDTVEQLISYEVARQKYGDNPINSMDDGYFKQYYAKPGKVQTYQWLQEKGMFNAIPDKLRKEPCLTKYGPTLINAYRYREDGSCSPVYVHNTGVLAYYNSL